MPLRDAAEWAEEYDLPAHDIRAIQRDAWEAAKEAAATLVDNQSASDVMRLSAGEMTAQERRTAQAVMQKAVRCIRALPFPGGEKGEG